MSQWWRPGPARRFRARSGYPALAAEQLLQHGAVVLIAHQVGRGTPPGRKRWPRAGGRRCLTSLPRLLQRHQLFGLLGEELGDGLPCLSITLGAAETDELVGFEITATRRAASSELKLKLSPVTEQPMGDEHQAVLIQLAVILHIDATHRPLWQKSMPSSHPAAGR